MRDIGKLSIFLLALFLPSVAAAGAAPNCKPLSLWTTINTVPGPGGVPLIPVSLSGKKALMLVDTGAFTSILFPGVVRELDLTPMPSNVRLFSVNGQSSTKMVRIPEFLFGRMRSPNHEFIISPNGDPAAVIGENDMAGVLGADVLQNYDVDFDFAGGTFTLFAQDHCPGQVLYWKPQVVAVVPFRLEDQAHITLPVMVNGTRVTAVFDTGASNTVMSMAAARRIFDFDPNAPNVEQVGQLEGNRTAAVYRTRIDKIELEGVTVSNPMINVLPDVMSRSSQTSQVGSLIPRSGVRLPDMLLGMSVLSKLHVYIAYKERKIYVSAPFAPTTAPAAPDPDLQ